jgi:hypothetical protein
LLVCVYLSLCILTTVCAYGRVLKKSISHVRFWKIVQDTDAERYSNSRSFSCYQACLVSSTLNTGPRFKVKSQRLWLFELASLGIRPTLSRLQISRSNRLSYAGWVSIADGLMVLYIIWRGNYDFLHIQSLSAIT